MHTVEEVAEWAGVSHEKGGPLDRAIENKQHISEVCTFMVQWETVASRLGFQEADIEGVNKDGSDTRRRRELMLERWRSMQGPQATYRTLGNAFVLEGKADLAKKVFELTKSGKKSSGVHAPCYNDFLKSMSIPIPQIIQKQ